MDGAGMSGVELESALLLPVPAAEAAVGAHRARLDSSARGGVPADAVRPLLPITTEATEVILMAGPPTPQPGTPGQWQTVASFSLG